MIKGKYLDLRDLQEAILAINEVTWLSFVFPLRWLHFCSNLRVPCSRCQICHSNPTRFWLASRHIKSSPKFQHGSGGAKLLALKFVEAGIHLYTPDPSGSSEPPSRQGKPVEFNISWLRRGHPVLNVGDLSIKASHSLGLLLDKLRFPTVKLIKRLPRRQWLQLK